MRGVRWPAAPVRGLAATRAGAGGRIRKGRIERNGLRLIQPRAYAEQGYPQAQGRALRGMPLTYFEPHSCLGAHLTQVALAGTPERTASNPVPGLELLPIRDRIRPAAAA